MAACLLAAALLRSSKLFSSSSSLMNLSRSFSVTICLHNEFIRSRSSGVNFAASREKLVMRNDSISQRLARDCRASNRKRLTATTQTRWSIISQRMQSTLRHTVIFSRAGMPSASYPPPSLRRRSMEFARIRGPECIVHHARLECCARFRNNGGRVQERSRREGHTPAQKTLFCAVLIRRNNLWRISASQSTVIK